MLFAQEFLSKIAALPPWERDAMRRLLEHGRLSDSDRDEVFELLLAEEGCSTASPVPRCRPVSMEDLRSVDTAAEALSIVGIVPIAGCNGLTSGSKLALVPGSGLNVVVGRNASGKSSYARLLRAAGHARIAPEILPDVMSERSSAGEGARVRFEIQSRGSAEGVDWRPGVQSSELASIAVFDRDCRLTYVDQGNVAEFLPGGLDVFAALVDLRKHLKARCESEAAAIRARPGDVPGFAWGTPVHEAVFGWGTWTGDTSGDERRLTRLAKWGDADQKQLDELETRANAAGALRTRQARVIQRLAQLEALENNLAALQDQLGAMAEALDRAAVDVRSLQQRRRAIEADLEAAQLRQAERLRTESTARSALLPGTGSPDWIALWRAAAEFSLKHAYPEEVFPFVGSASRCVLCQSNLSEHSLKTLRHLEDLADQLRAGAGDDGDIEDLRQAHKASHSALTVITRLVRTAMSGVGARVEMLPDGDKRAVALRGTLAALLETVANTIENVETEEISGALTSSAARARDAAEDVAAYASLVEEEHEEVREAIESELEPPEDPELLALRDRKLLVKSLPRVIQYCQANARQTALMAIAGSLSVTPLTSLSKKIATSLVSDRLIESIVTQLGMVGLDYIQAQVVTSGRAGVTTIRLAPPSATFKKLGLSEILSEGEQALLALAAFFAELEVSGHRGPLVLDDPVTGLDADNKTLIADRLGRAAGERQVIVFTHDTEFAQGLADAADFWGVAFHRTELQRAI